MDRAFTINHLAMTEGHIALGERHIFRQREIIADLARGGHDTVEAEGLLQLFMDTLAQHVETRDRLVALLRTP